MNIFITGASSGIGSSTVRTLCHSGHNVFGLARREEELEEMADECELYDGDFQFMAGDVTDLGSIKKQLKRLLTPLAALMCLFRMQESDISIRSMKAPWKNGKLW